MWLCVNSFVRGKTLHMRFKYQGLFPLVKICSLCKHSSHCKCQHGLQCFHVQITGLYKMIYDTLWGSYKSWNKQAEIKILPHLHIELLSESKRQHKDQTVGRCEAPLTVFAYSATLPICTLHWKCTGQSYIQYGSFPLFQGPKAIQALGKQYEAKSGDNMTDTEYLWHLPLIHVRLKMQAVWTIMCKMRIGPVNKQMIKYLSSSSTNNRRENHTYSSRLDLWCFRFLLLLRSGDRLSDLQEQSNFCRCLA